MTEIRDGGAVVRPSTGKPVRWTPIEPVADEHDAAQDLAGHGYSCLGVIGDASHLKGSGGHTPWCDEGYAGVACQPGKVYAIDLHAPDMPGLETWLVDQLRVGRYRWVFYLNINGRQHTRVDGWAKSYPSTDEHLHLSGLAGHENDSSSILRDWEAHRSAPAKSSQEDDMFSDTDRATLQGVGWALGVNKGQVPEQVRDAQEATAVAALDKKVTALAADNAAIKATLAVVLAAVQSAASKT